MTPADLAAAAQALFGFDFPWRRPLARALGVDDRRVRRWADGELEIPAWVEGSLAELAQKRREELSKLAAV